MYRSLCSCMHPDSSRLTKGEVWLTPTGWGVLSTWLFSACPLMRFSIYSNMFYLPRGRAPCFWFSSLFHPDLQLVSQVNGNYPRNSIYCYPDCFLHTKWVAHCTADNSVYWEDFPLLSCRPFFNVAKWLLSIKLNASTKLTHPWTKIQLPPPPLTTN
jgi:hypothetical protein